MITLQCDNCGTQIRVNEASLPKTEKERQGVQGPREKMAIWEYACPTCGHTEMFGVVR